MKGSLSIATPDKPVLSFELASLGCLSVYMGTTWRSVVRGKEEGMGSFALSPGGNCEGFSADSLRALLEGLTTERMYYATGLERDTAIPGELRFTPSRSATLATRRLDHYLGNSVTRPIEITVSEVRGDWTDDASPEAMQTK